MEKKYIVGNMNIEIKLQAQELQRNEKKSSLPITFVSCVEMLAAKL